MGEGSEERWEDQKSRSFTSLKRAAPFRMTIAVVPDRWGPLEDRFVQDDNSWEKEVKSGGRTRKAGPSLR